MREPRDRARRIAAMVVGTLVMVPLLTFLVGSFVKYLWNWLMPILFHLPTITPESPFLPEEQAWKSRSPMGPRPPP